MSDLAYQLPDNIVRPDPLLGQGQYHMGQVFPGIGEEQDANVTYVIPNIYDIVTDIKNAKEYYLESLDVNFKPTFKLWVPNSTPDEQVNTLVGYGVGAVNEAYRIYYNNTHVPNTLTVSSYVHFKGNNVVGYRLFRGYATDDEHGEVISKYFDQSGNYMGDLIPVQSHFADGSWISIPGVANVQDAKLKKDDPITLVAFNAEGNQCHSAILITSVTNFTPSLNREFKEVATISITSPYLDPNDSTRLLVPNNTTLWNLPAKGVVHYTDGTAKQFNLDQSEGRIHGLDSKVLSRPDVDYPLVVSYYLSDSEVAYDGGNGARRHKSINLTLRCYQPEGMNVVKLFVSPEYLGPTLGYRLNYWLYDLERNAGTNVTSLVTYHKDHGYDPLAYNNVQSMVISIDLSKVHPRYTDFVHVQNLDVILVGEPSNNADSWRIRYTEGAGWYGEDIEAVSRIENSVSVLNIANGLDRESEYFIDFYQKMVPISDEVAGIYAPTPTHMDIRFNGSTKRIAVADFDEDIIWTSVINEGSVIEILWLFEKGGTFGQLGITPMTVKGV